MMTEPREPGVCPDAPHDVEDLLDGLLDPSDETAMLAHLATCDVCREARDDEARLRDLLGAPAGLLDEVMDLVRQEPWPGHVRTRRMHPVRWVAAAAVLMVATLAVLLVGDGRDGGKGNDPAPPALAGEDREARSVASARARDLVRRARIFLAAAGHAPRSTLRSELEMSGLAAVVDGTDLEGLGAADRDAVRRVALLGEAFRNDAPVARAEIAMLTEGLR